MCGRAGPAVPGRPTPADIYERYYPVIRDALLRDTAYRNACDNNDKETAYVEGGKAIEQAALTIQDTGFMRLYYDVPEYHDRLHKSLLDETYKAMTATPELPDPPDRTSPPCDILLDLEQIVLGLPLAGELLGDALRVNI